MKQWMLLLSPVLFMGASIEAWGGRRVNQSGQAMPPPSAQQAEDASINAHFPLNADQGWFLEESYLLLKPTLGNLDYGDLMTANAGGSNASDFKIKVKNLDYNWNSGVRIGIGRYLPHHDHWDMGFYTTYFYADADERVKGNPSQFRGLSVNYAPVLSIFSNRTKAQWRLNYFVWDLRAAREFAMTPFIVVHPYVGLRGTVMYNDYKSQNRGDVTVSLLQNQTTVDGNVKISMEQNFWGIGPRVGSNFDYMFAPSWSFLGNLATSLLYGRYHIKNKTSTTLSVENLPSSIVALDHNNVIRVNLEGALGLGWEKWFKGNTVRVAPSFQFEGSLWFNMNDFFQPLSVMSQDHGNLALMGVSFNLQVDF